MGDSGVKRQAVATVYLIVFFLLLPIMVVSFYFAHLADNEASDFSNSPNFSSSPHRHGERYRLRGEVDYTSVKFPVKFLKNLPLKLSVENEKIYKIKDAISYKVVKQVFKNNQWQRDCSFSQDCFLKKVKELRVIEGQKEKAITIVVTPGTKFRVSINEIFRKIDEKTRWWIRYKSLPKKIEIWGTYEHGYLSDGLLDRLYVFPQKDLDEFKRSLIIKGARKSQWLNSIGVFLLFLMSMSLYFSLKK